MFLPLRTTHAGAVVVTVGLVVWCRRFLRRTRATLSSAEVRRQAVSIVKKDDGSEYDVQQLLDDARASEKWVVASNTGQWRLTVGSHSMSIDVIPESEIEVMLSHRWNPTVETMLGPVPIPMMEAVYDRPTWIDILNHFNQPDHCKRVLEGMGVLYASKPCRAIYFEPGHDEEVQVECASRAWMWQELSVGPQQHQYASIESLWLHHVVTEGEMNVFDSLIALSVAIAKLTALSLRCPAPPQDLKSLATFSWLWMRQLPVRAGYVALVMTLGMVALDVTVEPAAVQALDRGDLEAALEEVFAAHIQPSEERTRCLRALAAAAAADTERGVARQVMGVVEVLNGAFSALAANTEKVVLARERGGKEDTAIRIHLEFAEVVRSVIPLLGRREPGVEVGRLAMGMLWRRNEGAQLSSAVANLGNRNISYPEDLLQASFGALCAKCGRCCAPRDIEALIYEAATVNVHCLPADRAWGIAAVACKEVRVRVRNLRPRYNALLRLLFSVAFGRSINSGVCDELVLGDRVLRECPIDLLGPGWWRGGFRGLLTLFWFRASRRGQVMRYSVVDGALEDMSVSLEDGGHLELCGLRQARVAFSRREFTAWHAALPGIPGESW